MPNSCYCDHCQKRLPGWISNTPVFNDLLIRGRARCCNEPISVAHPAAEILGGTLIFVTGVFRYNL
jgi:general secretion pathway protein O